MIYLALPYSDSNPATREHRFECANRIASILIAGGEQVFSPISHSHPIAKCGIDGDWGTWREFDLRMIENCDSMIVLKLNGWEESKGIQAETLRAKHLGMPIKYIDPAKLLLIPTKVAIESAKAMLEDKPE